MFIIFSEVYTFAWSEYKYGTVRTKLSKQNNRHVLSMYHVT
jgi:hypothetical protein